MFRVRSASVEDLPELNKLQQACYPPSFYEDPEVFQSILEHNMSYVVEGPKGLVGYGLVHSIEDPSNPPCLNTSDEGSERSSEHSGSSSSGSVGYKGHVFIHDVSVEVGRGTRSASALRCPRSPNTRFLAAFGSGFASKHEPCPQLPCVPCVLCSPHTAIMAWHRRWWAQC